MRILVATGISLCMFISGAQSQTKEQKVQQETIKIWRSGSQPSREGPAEHFTGSVCVDPLFQANAPERASDALVTFEPGARAAWHTHPLGQILIVTAGTGRVQRWGDPVEEIHQGDVVWISLGQKHWHGVAPSSSMAHIAIVEQLDGKTVDWMERVSDAQYNTPLPAPGTHESGKNKSELPAVPPIPQGLSLFFMAMAQDDNLADTYIVAFYDALKTAGYKPEFSYYSHGGHG